MTAAREPAAVQSDRRSFECTNIGRKVAAERAWLQCMQTYTFADGQIVTAGVFRLVDLEKLNVAVVGGSGAYSGVGGSLTSGAPVQGYDSVDVLHLDRKGGPTRTRGSPLDSAIARWA